MRISSYIFLSMVVVLCSSCELLFPKTEEPKTELEKLPPITQEGKNTFGCLVNGKAFVPTNTMNIVAIFQQGNLQLGGEVRNDNADEGIIIFEGDPLIVDTSYSLVNHAMYSNIRVIETCSFEFEDTFSGSIVFLKIDRVNYIISGIFEFSAVKEGCDTIHITNGRFDMHFNP